MSKVTLLLLVVVLAGFILTGGCAQKPEEKKPEIPEVTPEATKTVPKKAMSLEKIEPVKERENVPEQFFPAKYP